MPRSDADDLPVTSVPGFPAEVSLDWTLGKLLDRAQMVAQFDVDSRTLEKALVRAFEGVVGPDTEWDDDKGRLRWLAEKAKIATACRDAVMKYLEATNPLKDSDMAKTATKPKSSAKAKPAKAKPAKVVQAPVPAPPPSEGIPATSGPESWAAVLLNTIRPCAFNIRQTFDPADIAGLGESIRAERLKEPLLVRPVGKKAAPTYDGERWEGFSHWELIDGERRLRALHWICESYPEEAKAASKVPVIVRPMTDDQVRAVMLLSREQSRDLVVSELVAGYARLRESLGGDEAVASLVGRPVAYVRSVLRLSRLPAWALAAVDAGSLPRATAELVARVPGEEGRKRCAACVLFGLLNPADLEQTWNDAETWEEHAEHFLLTADHEPDPRDSLSYRDTKTLIANHFQKELKGAPFSRKELYTLPGCEEGHERHIQSCDECPKRAGNDPEAQAEGTRADVCLDPDCYREKVQAYRAKEIAKAAEKGIEEADLPVTSYPGLPPKGWCEVSKAASETELGPELPHGGHKKIAEKEKLKDLLEDDKCPAVTKYIAFGPGGKAVTLVKTADARRALQAAGVLKKPEPRAKREEKKPAPPAKRPGDSDVPRGDQFGPRTQRAAFLAASVLAEYGEEQLSGLADLDDAQDEGPIREALRMIADAQAYTALVDGYRDHTQKDVLKARFPGVKTEQGHHKESEEVISKELDTWSAPKLLAFILQLSAAVEMEHDGPNRDLAKGMLAWAELDWPALEEQARRQLNGGESADEKLAKVGAAEKSPIVHCAGCKATYDATGRTKCPSCGRTHADPAPKAEPTLLLADIDNFPDAAADACATAGAIDLAHLFERMKATLPPQVLALPLRNRVATYLVSKLGVPLKTAEQAADAVAAVAAETSPPEPATNASPPAAPGLVSEPATKTSPPPAGTSELLAAIPGFPEAAANHLLDKGVFTLADLDAKRDAIRKERGRQSANRYEALKELGVPFSVVYKAGDALVEWEGKKHAPKEEPKTGGTPKAKKAKVTT